MSTDRDLVIARDIAVPRDKSVTRSESDLLSNVSG